MAPTYSMCWMYLLTWLATTSALSSMQRMYTSDPCVREDISTFRCEDYIPGDVPTGVKKVILEYFTNDQFINNSTFSTSGWRNITTLVLYNRPDARKKIIESKIYIYRRFTEMTPSLI